MRTVWKFPLAHDTVLDMPKGARILNIGGQGRTVMFWAELEDTNEYEKRSFIIIGTGGAIPDGAEYIGTVHMPPFVWHVYEAESESAHWERKAKEEEDAKA